MSMDNFRNKIICGDCLEIMRGIDDSCVDLFVTSPPYNLKNSSGNGMKDGRGGKWSRAALLNGYEGYIVLPTNQAMKNTPMMIKSFAVNPQGKFCIHLAVNTSAKYYLHGIF